MLSFILATPFRVLSVPTDVTGSGNRFVDLLARGDFAVAVAQYDDAMAAALPEEKLKETWQMLENQAGHFRKRVQTRTITSAGYNIALVTCEFERARLDAKVVFNAQGQVSGLFFIPSTAVSRTFDKPAYANTNAFRETNFTVGRGEWALPGTLTVPLDTSAGPCPAVVLVHGSGPNDRDETVGGVKVFRDLAWGLASRGIAVLRYEKRTRQHAARLINDSKLTVQEETIDDALSAVRQLRQCGKVDPKRIFVLGHSLGGMVAPRIGGADPQIAGLIIMAGPTRPIEDLFVEQNRYFQSLRGDPSQDKKNQLREIESQAATIKNLSAADLGSSKLLLGCPAAYWLDLRTHDPASEARSLKQPLLILQGGRDYQVTKADFDGWQHALAGVPTVSFKLYPDLNHLFVRGEGKSTPNEYDRPAHVAQPVVEDIARWVLTIH
jgi:hypothetical protein